MPHAAPFACITIDTGLAAELVHVSPIYCSRGPRFRGRFADRRIARVRRTDARRLRLAVQPPGGDAAFREGSGIVVRRESDAPSRWSAAN